MLDSIAQLLHRGGLGSPCVNRVTIPDFISVHLLLNWGKQGLLYPLSPLLPVLLTICQLSKTVVRLNRQASAKYLIKPRSDREDFLLFIQLGAMHTMEGRKKMEINCFLRHNS